jgi:hypothetical protein
MRHATAGLLLALLLSGCGVFSAQQLPPLPPGTRDCIGLAEAQCQQVLDSVRTNRNVQPAAWRIRCTKVCDANHGDVEVTITWSDGTTDISGMGWMGELAPGGPPQPIGPIPTPAVPPTCVRVPQADCLQQWAASLEHLSVDQWAQVVAVNVECTTSCNLIKGEGTTTVVLQDGSRVTASSWSYDRSP